MDDECGYKSLEEKNNIDERAEQTKIVFNDLNEEQFHIDYLKFLSDYEEENEDLSVSFIQSCIDFVKENGICGASIIVNHGLYDSVGGSFVKFSIKSQIKFIYLYQLVSETGKENCSALINDKSINFFVSLLVENQSIPLIFHTLNIIGTAVRYEIDDVFISDVLEGIRKLAQSLCVKYSSDELFSLDSLEDPSQLEVVMGLVYVMDKYLNSGYDLGAQRDFFIDYLFQQTKIPIIEGRKLVFQALENLSIKEPKNFAKIVKNKRKILRILFTDIVNGKYGSDILEIIASFLIPVVAYSNDNEINKYIEKGLLNALEVYIENDLITSDVIMIVAQLIHKSNDAIDFFIEVGCISLFFDTFLNECPAKTKGAIAILFGYCMEKVPQDKIPELIPNEEFVEKIIDCSEALTPKNAAVVIKGLYILLCNENVGPSTKELMLEKETFNDPDDEKWGDDKKLNLVLRKVYDLIYLPDET